MRAALARSLPASWLDARTTPPTYLHRLGGACRCGVEHAANRVASEPTTESRRRIASTYPYRAADRTVLYETVRTEPKGFFPRHPEPSGGAMVTGLHGVRDRVPYHLPELLAEPTRAVFWVEGEKDADRLTSAGLLATTTIGGAKSYRRHALAYAEHFRGRPLVAVITDRDDDGRAYAAEVASSLFEVGAGVRLIELPGLPLKGDVSDWPDGGHTVEELLARKASPPGGSRQQRSRPPRGRNRHLNPGTRRRAARASRSPAASHRSLCAGCGAGTSRLARRPFSPERPTSASRP